MTSTPEYQPGKHLRAIALEQHRRVAGSNTEEHMQNFYESSKALEAMLSKFPQGLLLNLTVSVSNGEEPAKEEVLFIGTEKHCNGVGGATTTRVRYQTETGEEVTLGIGDFLIRSGLGRKDEKNGGNIKPTLFCKFLLRNIESSE